MTEQDELKQNALSHILKIVATRSGKGVLYTTAILGLATLFPSLQLSGTLGIIAGGIGINALGSVLESVASGEEVSDDDIIKNVQKAISQSGIEELLSKDEFWHAFTQLRKGQQTLSSQNEVLLAAIKQIETSVIDTLSVYKTIPEFPNPYFAHPFPLQKNFVGRRTEKQALTDWLTDDQMPLLTVVAIGGTGKSSLVWSWLLDENLPSKQHGIFWWNFYRESETRFEKFIDNALYYFSNGEIIPESINTTYERTQNLVNLIREKDCLIILDGFERELRAYAGVTESYEPLLQDLDDHHVRACTNISASRFLRWLVAEPSKAKVIITSRLLPLELEGDDGNILPYCSPLRLSNLSETDAVEFLQKQGVAGLNSELKEITSLCFCQPLNLRLISGYILSDIENPGDASLLLKAKWNPNIEQIRRQNDILEFIYNSLTPAQITTASFLAASRIPFTIDTLKAISDELEQDNNNLKKVVTELINRNILWRTIPDNLFEFHPVIREYFYLKMPDKQKVHELWSKIFSRNLDRILQEPKLKTELDKTL